MYDFPSVSHNIYNLKGLTCDFIINMMGNHNQIPPSCSSLSHHAVPDWKIWFPEHTLQVGDLCRLPFGTHVHDFVNVPHEHAPVEGTSLTEDKVHVGDFVHVPLGQVLVEIFSIREHRVYVCDLGTHPTPRLLRMALWSNWQLPTGGMRRKRIWDPLWSAVENGHMIWSRSSQ